MSNTLTLKEKQNLVEHIEENAANLHNTIIKIKDVKELNNYNLIVEGATQEYMFVKNTDTYNLTLDATYASKTCPLYFVIKLTKNGTELYNAQHLLENDDAEVEVLTLRERSINPKR